MCKKYAIVYKGLPERFAFNRCTHMCDNTLSIHVSIQDLMEVNAERFLPFVTLTENLHDDRQSADKAFVELTEEPFKGVLVDALGGRPVIGEDGSQVHREEYGKSYWLFKFNLDKVESESYKPAI